MPIFEYRCDDCGSDFELLILDKNRSPECPHCNGLKLFKKISKPTIIYNGDGWVGNKSEERNKSVW